jgi:DNA polymerase-3 subunit delta
VVPKPSAVDWEVAGSFGLASTTAIRMLEKANNPLGEPLMIVDVITKYFRKLLQLSGLDRRRRSKNKMAGHNGVPPYYVDDYLSALKRYDRTAIERAMGALLAADYELKGGSERDTRTIFALLLMRIMERSRKSVPAGT